MTHQLQAIGISTIEQLAKTPLPQLEHLFGKWGVKLWEKAHGLSTSEVEGYSEQKVCRTKTPLTPILPTLRFCTTSWCASPKKCPRPAGRRTPNGLRNGKGALRRFYHREQAGSNPLHRPWQCAGRKVKDLFTRLYKGEKVRLLGVKFSHLVPMTLQMNLFDKEAERLQLFKTVDSIKAQFGVDAVKKASGLTRSTGTNLTAVFTAITNG